jgi:hypothetical protein
MNTHPGGATMQSEDLTDEEKRVANLTKRWDATHNKIGILVTIIAIAAPLIGFRLHHIFGLLTLCCLIGFLIFSIEVKRFFCGSHRRNWK